MLEGDLALYSTTLSNIETDTGTNSPTHWSNVRNLGINTTHSYYTHHLSAAFLSVVSEVFGNTIPDSRIKKTSTCHT